MNRIFRFVIDICLSQVSLSNQFVQKKGEEQVKERILKIS